jgi:hypothetical protein
MKAVDYLRSKGNNVALFVNFLTERGVKFQYKSEIWWMRLLGVALPDFNRYVVTTYMNTICLPKQFGVYDDGTGWDETDLICTLAHEYVHVSDNRKHKTFLFTYALPQLLGVFGFLALLGPLYTPLYYCASAFLLFLPLPSPFRLYWEFRGYTMSLAGEIWVNGKLHKNTFEDIIRGLTGRTYWMYAPEKYVRKIMQKQLDKIMEGDIITDQVFADVQMFLLSHRMLRNRSLPPPPPKA